MIDILLTLKMISSSNINKNIDDNNGLSLFSTKEITI